MKFLDKVFNKPEDRLTAIKKAIDLDMEGMRNDNRTVHKRMNEVENGFAANSKAFNERINTLCDEMEEVKEHAYTKLVARCKKIINFDHAATDAALKKMANELKQRDDKLAGLDKKIRSILKELQPMIKQWKKDHPKRKRGRPRKVINE